MSHLSCGYQQLILVFPYNRSCLKAQSGHHVRGEGFEGQTRQRTGDAEGHQAAQIAESVTYDPILPHMEPYLA